MLILALRNVLRAAEMACRYAERPEKQNLRAALARFTSTIPGLVNARDALGVAAPCGRVAGRAVLGLAEYQPALVGP